MINSMSNSVSKILKVSVEITVTKILNCDDILTLKVRRHITCVMLQYVIDTINN